MSRLLLAITCVFSGFMTAAAQQGASSNPAPAVKQEHQTLASSYPLVDAFAAAKEFVGTDAGWKASSEAPLQRALISRLSTLRAESDKIPERYLKSAASLDVEVVNRFLKEQGLTIQLKQATQQDAWYAASVLALTDVRWGEGKFPAEHRSLTVDGKRYEGFRISGRGAGITQYRTALSKQPIFEMAVNNPDLRVFATRLEGSIATGFDAIELAQRLSGSLEKEERPYDGLVLPMVNYNDSVSLDWILGIRSANGYQIAQALQQVVFKMDASGFSAKSGVALGASRGISHDYLMDGTFLFWVEMKGLSEPLFALPIEPRYWSNPNPEKKDNEVTK